jgi:hypothetical protein
MVYCRGNFTVIGNFSSVHGLNWELLISHFIMFFCVFHGDRAFPWTNLLVTYSLKAMFLFFYFTSSLLLFWSTYSYIQYLTNTYINTFHINTKSFHVLCVWHESLCVLFQFFDSIQCAKQYGAWTLFVRVKLVLLHKYSFGRILIWFILHGSIDRSHLPPSHEFTTAL